MVVWPFRLGNTPTNANDQWDAEFWQTVARDAQGFVRTQKEWDTLAAYARELADKVATLEALSFGASHTSEEGK